MTNKNMYKYIYDLNFKNSILPIEYGFISTFIGENNYNSIVSIGIGNMVYAISENADDIVALGTPTELNEFVFNPVKIKDTQIITGSIKDEIPKSKNSYDCFILKSDDDIDYDEIIDTCIQYGDVILVLHNNCNISSYICKKILDRSKYTNATWHMKTLEIGNGISIIYKQTEGSSIKWTNKDDFNIDMESIKGLFDNDSTEQSLKYNIRDQIEKGAEIIKSKDKKAKNKDIQNKESDYAIFTSASRKNLNSLNSLLDSIEQSGMNIDLYLLHHDLDAEYLRSKPSQLSFNIYHIKIDRSMLPFASMHTLKDEDLINKSMIPFLNVYGTVYKASCILNIHCKIRSKELINLFDLVNSTDKIIAHQYHESMVFDENYRMGENKEYVFKNECVVYNSHYSDLMILNVNSYKEVIKYYGLLSHNVFKVDNNNKILGDITCDECWNMAIYKLDRDKDIVTINMDKYIEFGDKHG